MSIKLVIAKIEEGMTHIATWVETETNAIVSWKHTTLAHLEDAHAKAQAAVKAADTTLESAKTALAAAQAAFDKAQADASPIATALGK